jgi:hypothetical protein
MESCRRRRHSTLPVDHWLDRSRISHGGSWSDDSVNDAQYVTRLFPFLALLITYWGIYAQTSTTFFNQVCIYTIPSLIHPIGG